MGITVLCLYPKPNGRKPPSLLYINEGFMICTKVKDNKNKKMAIFTL